MSDLSQLSIQGENLAGSVVEVRNSAAVSLGHIYGKNVQKGLVIDSSEGVTAKSVSVTNDLPSAGVHISAQKAEQHQTAERNTRWKKTKRFVREVSINAIGTALVSGASTISTAS